MKHLAAKKQNECVYVKMNVKMNKMNYKIPVTKFILHPLGKGEARRNRFIGSHVYKIEGKNIIPDSLTEIKIL